MGDPDLGGVTVAVGVLVRGRVRVGLAVGLRPGRVTVRGDVVVSGRVARGERDEWGGELLPNACSVPGKGGGQASLEANMFLFLLKWHASISKGKLQQFVQRLGEHWMKRLRTGGKGLRKPSSTAITGQAWEQKGGFEMQRTYCIGGPSHNRGVHAQP